jgi:hypothetical protein
VSTLTPQQATMKIEQAQPAVIAASIPAASPGTGALDPSLDPPVAPETNMDLIGTATGGEAPTAAAEGVIVGDLCMRPTSTTAAATKATIVHGDTALYANTAPQTDTVLRPSATGATTIQAIRGPQAPQTYSWKVGLTGSEQLKKLADGSVAVVDPTEPAATMQGVPLPPRPPKADTPAGIPDVATQLADSQYQIAKAEQQTGQSVVAVIARPWARDSAGTIVPATLTVSASTITLTVTHWTPPEPLAYPIYGVTDTLGRRVGAGDASGWYSYGNSNCSGEPTDPIGIIFAGTHAGVSNTTSEIAKHAGWTHGGQGDGDQWAQVWFHGGGFRCRAADDGMADRGEVPPKSRYHARLWLSWYPSGRPKTVATPHYEQFRECSYTTPGPGGIPIPHYQKPNHIVISNLQGPGGDSGYDMARHKLRLAFEAAGHRTETHFEGNTHVHIQHCDGEDNPAWSHGNQVVIYENGTR